MIWYKLGILKKHRNKKWLGTDSPPTYEIYQLTFKGINSCISWYIVFDNTTKRNSYIDKHLIFIWVSFYIYDQQLTFILTIKFLHIYQATLVKMNFIVETNILHFPCFYFFESLRFIITFYSLLSTYSFNFHVTIDLFRCGCSGNESTRNMPGKCIHIKTLQILKKIIIM